MKELQESLRIIVISMSLILFGFLLSLLISTQFNKIKSQQIEALCKTIDGGVYGGRKCFKDGKEVVASE